MQQKPFYFYWLINTEHSTLSLTLLSVVSHSIWVYCIAYYIGYSDLTWELDTYKMVYTPVSARYRGNGEGLDPLGLTHNCLSHKIDPSMLWRPLNQLYTRDQSHKWLKCSSQRSWAQVKKAMWHLLRRPMGPPPTEEPSGFGCAVTRLAVVVGSLDSPDLGDRAWLWS